MSTKADYIIVGFGLAGLCFAEQLRKQQKSFIVISSLQKSSSIVAGGMYNPVILKRFTLAWEADAHLKKALPFYKTIEEHLHHDFLVPIPILRIFNSIEEQNNWQVAADKPTLSPFLNPNFIKNETSTINAKYQFGKVTQSGRLKVGELIKNYAQKLRKNHLFIEEDFDYAKLKHSDKEVVYKNYTAKHIVFCEGFGLKNNPYFNYLPLKPSKGETLTIKAENLNVKSIIKSGVFIIPTDVKHHYIVGATYNWEDETWQTTTAGKKELIAKLNTFLSTSYSVVNQVAGIRPTVKDRRPLLGQHHTLKNLYILNGLGTRGVMVAPTVSQQLYDFIENKKPLNTETDIQRFSKAIKL